MGWHVGEYDEMMRRILEARGDLFSEEVRLRALEARAKTETARIRVDKARIKAETIAMLVDRERAAVVRYLSSMTVPRFDIMVMLGITEDKLESLEKLGPFMVKPPLGFTKPYRGKTFFENRGF